jgi:hypothetical protein
MANLDELRDRQDRLKRRIEMMEDGSLRSVQLMPIDVDWTPIRLDEAKQSLAAIERQIARQEAIEGGN